MNDYSHLNTYQLRAADTRSKRSYKRPTKCQREAMRKYLSGCGVQAMTAEECVVLGDHPHLTASQRTEWMGRAFAKGWQ